MGLTERVQTLINGNRVFNITPFFVLLFVRLRKIYCFIAKFSVKFGMGLHIRFANNMYINFITDLSIFEETLKKFKKYMIQFVFSLCYTICLTANIHILRICSVKNSVEVYLFNQRVHYVF